MMKRIVALVTSLFLLMSVLSGCSKQSEDSFIDENGTQYIVVRDDEGNIVINDSGKLQVYTVNENGKKQKSDSGEYITEYIDFNGQVVIGSQVETAEMKFTLPSQCSEDNANPGYFYYEPYGAEIFITYYNDDITKANENAEYNCESLLESYGSEVFEYVKYTINISNVECTAFKQRCTSSEYYKNAYIYHIPYDTGYYVINCIISTDHEKKINFDKFVETIVLK